MNGIVWFIALNNQLEENKRNLVQAHKQIKRRGHDLTDYQLKQFCNKFVDPLQNKIIVIEEFLDKYHKNCAAKKIQRAWRLISNDPYHKVGKLVILRRFDELRAS